VRRPKLPRPGLRRNKEQQPGAARKPRRRPSLPKAPKPPGDLWFRISTRFRAVGYWVREKAQIAGRAVAAAVRSLAARWSALSAATKRRTFAIAGLLVLYGVLKFAPVPLVPCSVSAYKECPPPNDAVALVPADAALYAHLTLERDSRQYELASDLAGELPDFQLLVEQLAAAAPTPSGGNVTLAEDVLPWAERDVALALLPAAKGASRTLLIAGVGDEQGADDFVAKIAPPGEPVEEEQDGQAMSVYSGGFATARVGDQLALGSEQAVRAALSVDAGKADAIDDDSGPLGSLPEVRFAEVYVSRDGVARLLGAGGPGASQLDTFVDYGATRGLAASATARDDGVEVNLVSDLDPKLLKASPTVFASLPRFEPTLVSEAGSRALAYVGVGELGPTLAQVLEQAGGGELAKSLRALAREVASQSKVDPVKDLLPALSGQAAVVAEPTDAVPFASLIVDGVDEDRASEALAKLQDPLLKALRAGGDRVPRFEETDEDGVAVRSVQVSGTVNLSYAIFDGRLVVSTDPAGIAAVRAGGDGLEGTDAFDDATNDLPGEVSALVFLNLNELLGLAEQAGLAEAPLYAQLSDDISNFGSLALAVTGSDEELRTELFLASD
jgi:hypothetical protein